MPPRASVVAYEVAIFLEKRIRISRQHFAVCIHVYTRTLGLLQQLFQVFEVVPTDEDTRIVAYADIYLCHFGNAVGFVVSLIEQSHCLYAVFACLEHKSRKLVCR